MTDEIKKKAVEIKSRISLIAAMIIGAIFIVSGIGKILGSEEVSSQVIDFITAIIPGIFLTEFTVYFLYHIFIPHFFPWAELVFGCFLLIGFVPRLTAILILPLLFAMTGSNIWAIAAGSYATCASCFGIFEDIFGHLTPVQSLIIDIVMIVLAAAIIVLHPGGLLSNRTWLNERISRLKKSGFFNAVKRNAVAIKTCAAGKMKTARRHMLVIILFCAGFIGLILTTIGAVNLISNDESRSNEMPPVIIDITIAYITQTEAEISWKTDKPSPGYVYIYDKNGVLLKVIAGSVSDIEHRVKLENLQADSEHYFSVSSELSTESIRPDLRLSFRTLAHHVPLVISEVNASPQADNSVIITWKTDKPGTGKVEYWITGDGDRITKAVDTLSTGHSFTLDNLDVEALYSFVVTSTDAGGNVAASEKESVFTLAIGPRVGKRAPDFTLKSLDGSEISLSDYSGKVILLDFWMTSCSGCRKKMPVIQEAFTRLDSKETAILGIHVEGRESLVQGYVDSEKLTFPVVIDPGKKITNLYDVGGVPTTFFIDRSGIIRIKDAEFEDADQLIQIFNSLL